MHVYSLHTPTQLYKHQDKETIDKKTDPMAQRRLHAMLFFSFIMIISISFSNATSRKLLNTDPLATAPVAAQQASTTTLTAGAPVVAVSGATRDEKNFIYGGMGAGAGMGGYAVVPILGGLGGYGVLGGYHGVAGGVGGVGGLGGGGIGGGIIKGGAIGGGIIPPKLP